MESLEFQKAVPLAQTRGTLQAWASGTPKVCIDWTARGGQDPARASAGALAELAETLWDTFTPQLVVGLILGVSLCAVALGACHP